MPSSNRFPHIERVLRRLEYSELLVQHAKCMHPDPAARTRASQRSLITQLPCDDFGIDCVLAQADLRDLPSTVSPLARLPRLGCHRVSYFDAAML